MNVLREMTSDVRGTDKHRGKGRGPGQRNGMYRAEELERGHGRRKMGGRSQGVDRERVWVWSRCGRVGLVLLRSFCWVVTWPDTLVLAYGRSFPPHHSTIPWLRSDTWSCPSGFPFGEDEGKLLRPTHGAQCHVTV